MEPGLDKELFVCELEVAKELEVPTLEMALLELPAVLDPPLEAAPLAAPPLLVPAELATPALEELNWLEAEEVGTLETVDELWAELWVLRLVLTTLDVLLACELPPCEPLELVVPLLELGPPDDEIAPLLELPLPP